MITQELLGNEWHDSKLGGTLKGVIDKTGDAPLSERANDIINAKAFIGIGSGLSWLAWGLGTPVTMISGFSKPYSEFKDCERIFTPEGKCNGCFNKTQLNAKVIGSGALNIKTQTDIMNVLNLYLLLQ